MKSSYLRIFILFGLAISSSNAIAQASIQQFQGEWSGLLLISNQGQITDSVEVLLTVEPLENSQGYTWKTEYLSKEYPIIKDYQLIPSDTLENVYVLDEQNEIYLYQYLHGNKLYSQFEVQGSQLSSSYELVDDRLIFEVISGKKLNVTNGVTNFAVTNVQRAVLERLDSDLETQYIRKK